VQPRGAKRRRWWGRAVPAAWSGGEVRQQGSVVDGDYCWSGGIRHGKGKVEG